MKKVVSVFLLLFAINAYGGPLSFQFDFTNGFQGFPGFGEGGGEITGIVRGLENNVTSSATSVEITSHTEDYGIGEYVTGPLQFNNWTVSNGILSSAYFASFGGGNDGSTLLISTFNGSGLTTSDTQTGNLTNGDLASNFRTLPNFTPIDHDVSEPPVSVPEPSSFILLFAGLMALGLRRLSSLA